MKTERGQKGEKKEDYGNILSDKLIPNLDVKHWLFGILNWIDINELC